MFLSIRRTPILAAILVVLAIAGVFAGVALTVGNPGVSAQDDSDSSVPDAPKWGCSKPPAPSLSLSYDSSTKRLKATYGSVTHSGHWLSINFRWSATIDREPDAVEHSPRSQNTVSGGSRYRTVSATGTYKATVSTTAERGGSFCDSNERSRSRRVVIPTPVPTNTPIPTETPVPTKTPTPDPTQDCGSGGCGPTETPPTKVLPPTQGPCIGCGPRPTEEPTATPTSPGGGGGGPDPTETPVPTATPVTSQGGGGQRPTNTPVPKPAFGGDLKQSIFSLKNQYWPILESGEVRVLIQGQNQDDFRFKLHTLPYQTGFWITDSLKAGCGGRLTFETGWITSRERINLVRCNIGTLDNVGMRLMAERKSDGAQFFYDFGGPFDVARHRDSTTILYRMFLGSISGESMPASYKQVMRDGLSDGIAEWKDEVSLSFVSTSRIHDADVTINGYLRSARSVPCDRGVLACVGPMTTDDKGHLGQQTMSIAFPPSTTVAASEWTTEKSIATTRPSKYYYLSHTMTHELGHVFGLGHSPQGNGVMQGSYSLATYSSADPSGADQRAARGAIRYHQHPASP